MDNRELLIRAKNGDKNARETLVDNNIRLVHSIVNRFTIKGFEREDLFQIGCVGLIKAIDKFDESFEVQFSTYAVPMIMGEIKRFLRDDGMVKVSRSVKENSWKVNKCISNMVKINGREPGIDEIARETGLEISEILMALETSRDVQSIYKTVYSGDGKEICLIDQIGDESISTDKTINNIVLCQIIDELDQFERKIIIMRYFDDRTQCDIAKELGISQVQVSRIEKKILFKMREKFNM
ncbi:MAG: SigF/SigG family RNA polymerase sporulation sigma factor [Lachnospiraceae bacterium]|nr:SigF/SigG family RNA polymerase sporulation sigma factor [Lachnospiraceae bacterium]